MRRIVRFLLVAALLCGATWGLWSALHGHGRQLESLLDRPGALPWLAAAVAVDAAGLVLGALAWRYVLAGLGSPLGARATARVFSAALAGKYLPGPLWNVATSVHLGRRAGVPVSRMIGTYLLNSVVLVVTAAVVGMMTAPSLLGVRALWLAPVLLLGAALVWRPGLAATSARLLGRVVRRPMPALRVDASRLRTAMLLECVSWLVWGMHLWFITVVLGVGGASAAFVCVGGFALAAAAGALAVVVPDGAGVRELVLMAALSTVMPPPLAAAAALASRACCTVTEVLGAVLVLLVTRDRPRAPTAGPSPSTERAQRPSADLR